MDGSFGLAGGEAAGEGEDERAPFLGEALLIDAIRATACPGADPRRVDAIFARSCGRVDGRRMAVAFRALLILLALYGRRPLGVAPPGWPEWMADERRLLQLVAAAQAGRAELVAAHLTWLLRPCPARPQRVVGAIADLLAQNGLRVQLVSSPR